MHEIYFDFVSEYNNLSLFPHIKKYRSSTFIYYNNIKTDFSPVVDIVPFDIEQTSFNTNTI